MKCFFVFSAFAVLLFGSDGNLNQVTKVEHEKGSGVFKTEARNVDPFDSIEFIGAADIQITCGSPSSLTLTADDNLMEYLSTEVVSGTLKISTMTKSISPTKRPTFKITIEELKLFKLRGAYPTRGPGPYPVGKLREENLSRSSNVVVSNVSGEHTSFIIKGTGRMQADGLVDRLDVNINGWADADLAGVAAKQATIEVKGRANIGVNASEKLNIKIAGNNNIDYFGSPEIQVGIAGSGNIQQIESE